MTSKSSGSAPGATPTATRPGNRAASQATSSATSATGRSGRSIGHGAHHPVRIASSSQPVTCSGLGEYPAKPPWCSLVITPSKPTSAASAAWAAELLDDARGVELVVRVEPHRHGVRAHRAGG